MKKILIPGILFLLAALVAIGSVTFLGPCVHEDGSEAPCVAAGRAVLADGCLLAALALVLFFLRKPALRRILFGIAFCAAGVGIFFPGTLFRICKMDTMHCRMVMQPAMILLFSAALIVCAVGFFSERIRKNA